MRFTSCLVIAALAALSGCSGSSTTPTPPRMAPTARADSELQATLDAQLATNAARYGVVGQAVSIMRDGAVAYRGVHGVADLASMTPIHADHVFPVFSVSKLFPSILLVQLVDRGELDLDEPASRYVPTLPDAWRTIAVRDFLDHTSGVGEYFDGDLATVILPPTLDAAIAGAGAKPLQFPTGKESRYTQTNFLVVEAILEAHYGKPYREIATERIIRPLGLRDTYLGAAQAPRDRLVTSYRGVASELAPDLVIAWPEYAIVHAELFTTIDDLGMFLTAVCQGKLVRPSTLLSLWGNPHLLRSGGRGEFAAGLEWGERGAYREIGHEGGGKVRTRIIYPRAATDSLAHDTTVIVYLVNGSSANVWSRKLVDSVEDLVMRK
jgi:D-alanyl-D-alanine carboxypeptidase